MIWIAALVVALAIAVLVIAAIYDPGGGSYVAQDGRIIEWDGEGRVLHPDGRMEEHGTL